MTRRWLALVALAVSTATSALAADMPPSRYMPPPRAPAAFVPFFTWNGAYVGINGGYGFGKSTWTDPSGSIAGNLNVTGGLGGGTLGYNMQFGSAVFGLETDIDWSDISGTSTVGCSSCTTRNMYIGTARGRLGYALDRFLPYFTGGMAYGDLKASTTGGLNFHHTEIGWTVGGGLEYAFLNNLTAKIEYLYVDLGTMTCDAVCSGATPIDVKFTTSLVRGGINFKF